MTCRKIDSAHKIFGSFHVTAERDDVKDTHDPLLWPAGIYVCRYFEAHRPKESRVSGVTGITGLVCSDCTLSQTLVILKQHRAAALSGVPMILR